VRRACVRKSVFRARPLAAPCREATSFRFGHLVEELPDGHATVDPACQPRAGPDVLVPDALEIEMADPDAWVVRASARPVDLRARLVAGGSNSVSEVQALKVPPGARQLPDAPMRRSQQRAALLLAGRSLDARIPTAGLRDV
jgi:hypothetical protein